MTKDFKEVVSRKNTMKLNYQRLTHLLKTGGLTLQNQTWTVDKENAVILSAECVTAAGNKVDTKWGASYTNFSVKAKSLEGLIEEIWERATKEVILIGTYGRYTHIIEWLPADTGFRNRPLIPAELAEYNCSL